MAKRRHGASLDGDRHDGSGEGLPLLESLQAAPHSSKPRLSRTLPMPIKEFESQTDPA
jgi:hypothetical protein